MQPLMHAIAVFKLFGCQVRQRPRRFRAIEQRLYVGVARSRHSLPVQRAAKLGSHLMRATQPPQRGIGHIAQAGGIDAISPRILDPGFAARRPSIVEDIQRALGVVA